MDNLTNISVIKSLFEKHGFTFSKALGQNFLTNSSIISKIAEQGNSALDMGVIEIGTGVGVLTNELAKTAKKVVAIEIDDRLIPLLEETLSEHTNVKIINEDVLKVDLKELINKEFNGLNVAVCANLPYYITSPIIMKLLEEELPIKSITVMVQKEAGRRLCADLGSREAGAVTVAVRFYSEPKMLFNVSRGNFIPSPNVDSCVIRLDIKEKPKDVLCPKEYFFKVVRASFCQRRKTLINSLSSGLSTSKDEILKAIEICNIKPTARPEELKMENFIALANSLYNQQNLQ